MVRMCCRTALADLSKASWLGKHQCAILAPLCVKSVGAISRPACSAGHGRCSSATYTPSTKYAKTVSTAAGCFPTSLARRRGRQDVGQAAFEAAFKQHGFVVILPSNRVRRQWALPGTHGFGDGHDVEAEIELAIATAGKPVAKRLAGGHLDRGGAGVTGERGGRLEYRRRY
jgi:hypothetical protein